jgi:DNA-binding response OmpR family regulator
MPCRIQTADSCHTAFQSLAARRISIVVCERDLPDGSWRDVLERLGSSPERPYLIVTSRLADEWLWAEVLNIGGYDVLAKPFNAEETRHVLETACLHRRYCYRGQQAAAAG